MYRSIPLTCIGRDVPPATEVDTFNFIPGIRRLCRESPADAGAKTEQHLVRSDGSLIGRTQILRQRSEPSESAPAGVGNSREMEVVAVDHATSRPIFTLGVYHLANGVGTSTSMDPAGYKKHAYYGRLSPRCLSQPCIPRLE